MYQTYTCMLWWYVYNGDVKYAYKDGSSNTLSFTKNIEGEQS